MDHSQYRPRLLGIDFGEKRVGIAISDPFGMTAQALPHLINSKNLFTQLKELCSQYQVAGLVIGLPLNRQGEDTMRSQQVREFADQLQNELEIPYQFVNEHSSSKLVEADMIAANRSRKSRKQYIDSAVAARLLQQILNQLAS